MSHVVLGIIGVLLASAAALMVVNYGGEAYAHARLDGNAATVENALSNVSAAYRLYETRTGTVPTDLSQLLSEDDRTLEYLPTFQAQGNIASTWQSVAISGLQRDVVVINGIDEGTCRAINRRLEINEVPDAPVGVFGCYSADSSRIAYRVL